MEETKKKLYVEPDGFWTEASILFMALAIVFRMIGSIGRWNDLHYLVTLVALPVFSGLLFMLCLLIFSKRAFWTTVIPVVFGDVFFIFLAMQVENEWGKVGSIAIYVVIVVFYTMAFSHPKLKWVLAVILLLVFAGHVGLKDLPVLMDLENPVSFVDGMQEMSVLGIILSLLSVTLAMRMSAKPAEESERPGEGEELADNRKAAREKKAAKGKKAAKDEKTAGDEKPAAEDKPAPAPEVKPAPEEKPVTEEKPAAEEKPAQTRPAESAHVSFWEQPAREKPVKTEDRPVETVIVPERVPVIEPAEVFPLEEAEKAPDTSPADENGRDDP